MASRMDSIRRFSSTSASAPATTAAAAAEPVDTRNRRRSHPSGTRDRVGYSTPSCGRWVNQPDQQRNSDRRTDQRRQRRAGRLAGAMPGRDRTDEAEQSDADDTSDDPSHGQVPDDHRCDRQDGDDSHAQRRLVVGAEPLNRHLLEPRRYSVDELAADRVDRRDDVDDAGDQHADGDCHRAGDQTRERAVQRGRRCDPAFVRTRRTFAFSRLRRGFDHRGSCRGMVRGESHPHGGSRSFRHGLRRGPGRLQGRVPS